MSPRRNRGRRGGFVPRGRGAQNQRGAKVSQSVVMPSQPEETPTPAKPAPENSLETNVEEALLKTVAEAFPAQIKISNMPNIYNAEDFRKYLIDRFKIPIPKIISTAVNHPWVIVGLNSEEDQAALLKALDNHVWRMKKLTATAWPLEDKKRKLEEGDESEQKKLKKDEGDPAGAIMLDTLPFLEIPYENQNRLSVQDAEMMATRLHGFLCSRNPSLLGWAEKSCEANNGFLFKIEPLKVCTTVQGYKNKCKFRIGINSDGATTVGFVLNENNNKILGVEPGDKFIHMPESMKYAAKKFQDFLRKGRGIPYDKKKKTGTWDNLLIRVAPDGALMLIGIISPKELNEEGIENIKTDLKEFYEVGEGKDCNVFSLYLQIFQEQHPNYPSDKLTLLMGKPDYEELICGLKFYVSPFSILNINPISSENIYNSVIELAEPTPDSVVIDVCAGSCGIAFTFANKVEKCYAIERKEENIRDALKTKELNNITNVEIIKGKCEDHLEELFNKLKDKPLIVVLDPPRHGVVSQTVAQIRQQTNVKKVIYVCSNSKTGVKNFLDFSAKEGREPGGQLMKGLPFLPVRAIPIDVAPFTANNTIVVLLERIDPSTYPPAKNPAPEPPPEVPRKRNTQVKRLATKRPAKPANPTPTPKISRGARGGRKPPLMNRPLGVPPVRPLMSGGSGWMPPSRSSAPSNRNNYIDPNILINKYERRIAELEQRERAFKNGLSMGMQVSNYGFQSRDMPANTSNYNERFEFNNPVDPWQSNNGSKFNNQRNPLGFGSHATDDYYPNNGDNNWSNNGPSQAFGYGAHAAFGEDPLPRSRFAGFGNNRSNFANRRGTSTRGAGPRGGGPREGSSRGSGPRGGSSRGSGPRGGSSRGSGPRGGPGGNRASNRGRGGRFFN